MKNQLVNLLGLQDAADRLINLGSRIPEQLFPNWFKESRKMLRTIRKEQLKCIKTLTEDETKQFAFISTHKIPKNLQSARSLISKLIKEELKGKVPE